MRIVLTDSPQEFKNKVLNEYYKEINSRLAKRKEAIISKVRVLTKQALQESPTYKSLVSGELAYHFGFRKGEEESRLQPILNTFVNSINAAVKPFSRNGGEFRLFGIVGDYSDVQSLPEAQIEGKPANPDITVQYPLPWLNWLLLQGNKSLIPDFEIELGAASSRSGKAIMVTGGGWSVPDAFSGTIDDNWITKAIGGVNQTNVKYAKALELIIEKELEI